jgi:hypothetical protein
MAGSAVFTYEEIMRLNLIDSTTKLGQRGKIKERRKE